MTAPQAALVEALPALPEPTQGLGAHRWAYSAGDMRAYGEACARAALAQAEAAQPVAATVYAVESKTACLLFSRREDAERAAYGGSPALGLRVVPMPVIGAAPQPAEAAPKQEAVERLLFEARQAMIDYGSAEKRGDQEDIRASTTRAVDALDKLAALAAQLQQPAPELVAACPHQAEPRGCYRVRCQLGRKCAEAAPQTPATTGDEGPSVEVTG